MKTYLFTYRMDGAEYVLELPGDSIQDAHRRLDHIKFWSRYDGELVAKVPAVPGVGPVLSIVAWIRNMFHG
jgi:hypothetical protein